MLEEQLSDGKGPQTKQFLAMPNTNSQQRQRHASGSISNRAARSMSPMSGHIAEIARTKSGDDPLKQVLNSFKGDSFVSALKGASNDEAVDTGVKRRKLSGEEFFGGITL